MQINLTILLRIYFDYKGVGISHVTNFSGVRSFGSLVEERIGLVVVPCADVRVFYQYNSPIRSQVLLLSLLLLLLFPLYHLQFGVVMRTFFASRGVAMHFHIFDNLPFIRV